LQNAFPPDKNFLVLSCWMILPFFFCSLWCSSEKSFCCNFLRVPFLTFLNLDCNTASVLESFPRVQASKS
jgi:hypothetical protein